VTRARNRSRIITESVELVLAIDPALERLPWEALDIYRESKCGITRLPHSSFAVSAEPAESASVDIDPAKVFFLLNPSGDLAVTQNTFQDIFESTAGWHGYIGLDPRLKEVDNNLKLMAESDIFLYCGHGAGEAFIPPRDLAKVSKMPVCVLMGCSSGRLEQYSDGAESSGTALEYLLAGAPAVVANLWDVSDKDIDRLTGAFLFNWLGTGKAEDIGRSKPEHNLSSMATALALSRTACRLPYLVGAATVIYGRANLKVRTKLK
jgi:separase